MATPATKTNNTVEIELVPWDYCSAPHVERMVEQRRSAGWMAEAVPSWVVRAEAGGMDMFWVVLADATPGREEMLEAHGSRYPKEKEPLNDTATTLYSNPREPTGRAFVAIGHVSLNPNPSPGKEYYLDHLPKEHWITALYTTWALQSRGIGRAVMARLEAMMVAPPLNGAVAALDAIKPEIMRSEFALRTYYQRLGVPVPKMSNQEWYQRQRYEFVGEFPESEVATMPDGDEIQASLMLMMKRLK
ncbi:Uu.00g022700.m01.CDS01 [Anthostomella pinea]|uniref:Uu.00g022700.m01.CDS01 n=1 Tax=Anthostomella pinea TaxID=933095 RepID=A0AAI8YR24_9PEZI|nr:Uu.00g022700.m01.CDS01 [Anthostomella pinea]